jgi:hypothetical protein
MPPNRSTGDALILMVAATVCLTVAGATAAVLVVEVQNPGADTGGVAGLLINVLSILLGMVAGYLAGRSGSRP